MFIDFFATEVALITTNSSKNGPNAMAFEWTMQIAYDPILIAIHTHFVEFKTLSKGQFILKAELGIIRDENNKLLLMTEQSFHNFLMLPMVGVKRGSVYADTLHKYLETIGMITEIECILGIERV